MRWLRHLTSGTIPVGPFVASSDGRTPRTGLALQAAANKQLLVFYPNGIVSSLSGSTWIEPAAKGGMYQLRYQGTTLVSTPGDARLFSARSSWLAVWEDYRILPQRAYDARFAESSIWTRVGLALPAAAADGAGGLPISDAGGLDLDAFSRNASSARLTASSAWGRVKLALPAAAADGAGGLPISDAGGLDLDLVALNASSARLTASSAWGRISLALPSTVPDGAGGLLVSIAGGLNMDGFLQVASSAKIAAEAVDALTKAGGDGDLDAMVGDLALVLADTGTDGVLLASSGAIFVDGVALEKALKVMLAVLANEAVASTPAGTVAFKNRAVDATVLTVTHDAIGNRTDSVIA